MGSQQPPPRNVWQGSSGGMGVRLHEGASLYVPRLEQVQRHTGGGCGTAEQRQHRSVVRSRHHPRGRRGRWAAAAKAAEGVEKGQELGVREGAGRAGLSLCGVEYMLAGARTYSVAKTQWLRGQKCGLGLRGLLFYHPGSVLTQAHIVCPAARLRQQSAGLCCC